MKLSRFLTGLAPALAIAALIGFAAPRRPADGATPSPAASAAAPPRACRAGRAAPPAPRRSRRRRRSGRRARRRRGRRPPPRLLGDRPDDKCTPNSGDTAWMLTSMALVLMMTIPGPRPLLRRHGPQEERRRHGDDQLRHHLPGHRALRGRHLQPVVHRRRLRSSAASAASFLQGILSDVNNGGIGNPNSLAPTIPETVYMCFQMTFAIITPALIAGAFAERMKFSAMLWFIGLWAICVYAPVAHWVWGPDGMFSTANVDDKGNFTGWKVVLDYAGGTVVHINAGVAGLCTAHHARQAPRHRAPATTWS